MQKLGSGSEREALYISGYRRTFGVIFVCMFYLLGFVLVVPNDLLPNAAMRIANAVQGSSPFDPVLTGVLLLLSALVTTPFILFPFLLGRYPKWVYRNYPEAVLTRLRGLIGATRVKRES